MTNYEAIKNMSETEMATFFYLIMKPVCDALGVSEEDRETVRKNIRGFLQSEVHASTK